jgi:hypothetical protein
MDPIALSASIISFVIPKLCDGMLEKFGGDLGQKGIRKAYEAIGSIKQIVHKRFGQNQDVINILDSEDPSLVEVQLLQSVLTKELTEYSDFLNEINQIRERYITATPELAILFRTTQTLDQSIAEFMTVSGTLEIESIEQEGSSSSASSQGILNSTNISEKGSVKIGKITQRGN